jgi:hypothetical protein
MAKPRIIVPVAGAIALGVLVVFWILGRSDKSEPSERGAGSTLAAEADDGAPTLSDEDVLAAGPTREFLGLATGDEFREQFEADPGAYSRDNRYDILLSQHELDLVAESIEREVSFRELRPDLEAVDGFAGAYRDRPVERYVVLHLAGANPDRFAEVIPADLMPYFGVEAALGTEEELDQARLRITAEWSRGWFSVGADLPDQTVVVSVTERHEQDVKETLPELTKIARPFGVRLEVGEPPEDQ